MNSKQAASVSASGKALEVGPDRPYRTIQAAVNEAEEGSDIRVYPGLYAESVSVTKNYLQITAQGHGVVMEPPHTAGFLVNADHVTIRGFEFRLANECANAVRAEGIHNAIVENTCLISHSSECQEFVPFAISAHESNTSVNTIDFPTMDSGDSLVGLELVPPKQSKDRAVVMEASENKRSWLTSLIQRARKILGG